jgi:threonine dehydratase
MSETLYEKIEQAQKRLEGIISKTPLVYSDVFSQESKNDVYIKPENFQKTGAFKIRGAYNKIASLTDEQRAKGVIASSAGNHAQGVAYAATLLGCKSIIVMPTTTPLIKVNSTKNYGAEVVLHGECYDDAYAKACELQSEHDYTFVHPFNDDDVIAGQGTIGIEILEEIPDADYVLIPVGGGGLISGIAAAIKAINPAVKILGVEPEGAMAMKKSLEHKKIITLTDVHTIAEGVAVKQVGDKCFKYNQAYVDGIISVSDYDIMEAFLLLLEKHKMISENAGALALAGLKKIPVVGKKVVCLLSGGNIDVVTVSSMINKGLSSRGRIFCFSVDLPDVPGQLLAIANVLTNLNANVIKLDHNQFMNFDRFMNVQLQVTVETNSHEHIKEITATLEGLGYSVTRVY